MDSVRFGKALGLGARNAVKTLATAVDAATAENPAAKPSTPAGKATAPRPPAAAVPPRAAAPAQQVNRPIKPAASTAATTAAKTITQARDVKAGVRRGSKRCGAAVWNPFVRLSGVLWLEVTGFFFGVLAAFAIEGIWKARAEWHLNAPTHQHLIGALGMTVLFGYFCVSSFLRARRRERGR